MAFAFTTPTVSTGYGYKDPIKSTSAGFAREDFLNEIVDSINKATGRASSKVKKAGGIADILSLLSMFLPPGYREAAIGATKLGETLYTQGAMTKAQKEIDKQAGRGFMSSTLPEYAKDWKSGTKDMLVGNILEGLTSTAMPLLMKKFPGKVPTKDIAQNNGNQLQKFLQSLSGGSNKEGDIIDSLIKGMQYPGSIPQYQSLLRG